MGSAEIEEDSLASLAPPPLLLVMKVEHTNDIYERAYWHDNCNREAQQTRETERGASRGK